MKITSQLKLSLIIRRVLLLVLICSLLLSFGGCQKKYKYPEWFNGEYCQENYTMMSKNYVHSRAYKNAADDKSVELDIYGYGGSWYFHALHGESIDDYVVGFNWVWFIEQGRSRVFKAKNNDIDPIYDYTIKSVELCTVIDGIINREDSLNYEEYCTKTVLDKTSEPNVFNSVSACYSNHDSTIHGAEERPNYTSTSYQAASFNGDASGFIVLRVRFEETDSIMWQSKIYESEGKLYLVCGECEDNPEGFWPIPLDETLTNYIKSVFSSNPGVYFRW